MKKLLSGLYTVDPSRLFIPISETMEHLQEAYSEAIDEAIRAFIDGTPSGGYILRGCVDTVVGASNSISEGAIYYFLNAGAWSSVTTYGQYDLISRNGYEYVSINAGNLNHDPATSPTYWARVGGHLTGQVFQTDAIVLNPLANVVVAKIVPTFASTDPTAYTDGTTANVHATFKIKFFDAVTGTGISDFTALQQFKNDDWHAPTLAANWTNSGGTNPAGYIKEFKTVNLKGLVVYTAGAPASNVTIFTLPSGYRPSKDMIFPIYFLGAANITSFTGIDFMAIKVATTGVVTLLSYLGSTFSTYDLSSVSFKVQ